MPNPERMYALQQEKKGPVDWYKDFNKLTRNVGLVVLGGALIVGSAGVATVAALSVVVDQTQIMIIDKYKAWREGSKR